MEDLKLEIEELEERIAPSTLVATPPAGQAGPVPPGGATVPSAATAANGAGGVVSVT